ncbi:MAG: MBL fold metallo-hydrolase [Candidatus Aminicenantes bacterium]|nr:MBL fold metallo-hydrolase [Candidatus Aminicenantes bacterium]
MKYMRNFVILSMLLSIALPSSAQTEIDLPFRIQRLSERVLLLTEVSPMENIIVALASEKGLVVFDSTGSPYTAALVRKTIEKEFGRSDFAYVVNTHHHWDHAWGNQVFPEAKVLGHEECLSRLIPDSSTITQMTASAKERMDNLKIQLKDMASGAEEASDIRIQAAFQERIYRGLSSEFTPVIPSLSFSDRMTLDLGDLTLKMFYFGRAHSGSDILIQIPEEGLLLTGDLFLDIGWLPLFSGMPELDISRWIKILNTTLDGEDEVTTVIPGHRKIWTKEKLVLWRDYIVNLWEGVQDAKSAGFDLERTIRLLPLENKYFYLKELGHSDTDLEQFQRRNVSAFWRQLFTPAVPIIEQEFMDNGIDAGIKKYQEMKKNGGTYLFDETSFNALGYRFLSQREVKKAIAVFKLNVEAYLESWNVYDSLGEAYMNDGQIDLAVRMYEKSLELNPENNNAVEMLKRLKKKPFPFSTPLSFCSIAYISCPKLDMWNF